MKIFFGDNGVNADEWLYNYFNSVKDNPKDYKTLYQILVSVGKIKGRTNLTEKQKNNQKKLNHKDGTLLRL